jgi:membrane-associated phospholipid phosphatase
MMPVQDLVVAIIMTIFLIVGVYQFYFFTQNHMIKEPKRINMKIDNLFKFKGWWVWIYSGLYYPMIVLIVLTMEDMRHYNYTAMSFFLLLFMQMAFFRYYPVETPPEWRDFGESNTLSVRFMKFVQSYDDNTNCFPSMHVSVATLVALHMWTNVGDMVGYWPFLFPVLIAFSALWTKQHYLVDVIAGAPLGWLAWFAYESVVTL